MGGQQSKDKFLYEQAIQGNHLSLPPLRNQGAGLEWADKQGKTALIVACSRPDLFQVAQTLIDLGSKVHAYSRGNDGGTPLHHAARSGLLQTVKLLLSRGANLFVRNDNGETPLDVAINKGNADIVRAIEGRMCLFSGWLREFYGPGLSEVVARSWVVIVPSGHYFPLELTVYSNLLSTNPRKAIDLRCADIEEPNFQESDPSLIICDKSIKTRYKFASGYPGDKQQIQWLYNACRGIHEVRSGIHQHNDQTSAPSNGKQTVVGSSITEASKENGWGNAAHDSSQNGWGSLAGPMTSEVTNGWMDEPRKEEYNGWGSAGEPATTESNSNGWGNESREEEYNGWASVGVPTTSEASNSSNGWRDEPRKEESNGWDTPETKLSNTAFKQTETKVMPNELPTAVASIPSAPPLPNEDFDDDPIPNPGPRLDSRPVHVSDTCTDEETLRANEPKDGNASSSTCVICWDTPAEAACVPCGHMAACMPCLNEIKSNQGNCPVCRAKIDQVIRIYAASV